MPASSQSYLYRQDKYTSVSRKSQEKWGFLKAPAHLIKILKLGYRDMVKRKKIRLRHGDVLDVEEYHDGNYGSPGKSRQKKEKPTKEQVRLINQRNKVRRCRWRLIQYFDQGDLFITWTYAVGNRPPDMEGALKDFRAAITKIRKIYRALSLIHI